MIGKKEDPPVFQALSIIFPRISEVRVMATAPQSPLGDLHHPEDESVLCFGGESCGFNHLTTAAGGAQL